MDIIFQDVAQSAEIRRVRIQNAFSVAWVDFNRDGLADLWVLPHGVSPSRLPRLYLNQGNGNFSNIISQVWPDGIEGDTHGSAWADFDNDGDPDLFISTGAASGRGQGPKLFFVNQGGQLQEQAKTQGLDYPLGRGRSLLWLDLNNDRLLDILQVNFQRPDGQAPTALFQQTSTDFQNVNNQVGLNANVSGSDFAQLADLTGDGRLDLIIHSGNKYPLKVYDTSTTPFRDLTNNFGNYLSVSDVAIADFNGDLRPDLFLARALNDSEQSSLFQINEQAVLADLVAESGQVGVSFKTSGNVFFDFTSEKNRGGAITPAQIFVGSGGHHPTKIAFSLSPDDPTARGIKPHTPGTQAGLYIGYNPTSQTWQALLSNPNSKHLKLVAETSAPLYDLSSIGFGPLDLSQAGPQNVLLQYDNGSSRYINQSSASGLGEVTHAEFAVAGDFDNDMDQDLYLSNGYPAFNLPNTLYENQGDGTFVAVPDTAGATDPHKLSIGSRMVAADYDNNGFLDIFVTHSTFRTTTKSYLGAPEQLFRNLGNDNHWIQLDLQGVASNRDGIGARVLVTAGGVTQLRERAGGMHAFGQDQQRLHFGLANHTQVERIEIQWPSGTVQVLNNIAADQILQVVESTGPLSNPITGNSTAIPLKGADSH